MFKQLRNKSRFTRSVCRLLQEAPELGVSSFTFLLPVICTLVAVLFDGAALVLISPLLSHLVQSASELTAESENSRIVVLLLKALGLGAKPSALQLIVTIIILSISAIPLRKFAALKVEITAKKIHSILQPYLVEKVLSYGMLYFNVSDLSKIHEARIKAAEFVVDGLRVVYRGLESAAFVAFYIFLMFSISWELASFFAAASIIIGLSSCLFKRKVELLSDVELKLSSKLRRRMSSCFESIELVKGNHLERIVVAKIETTSKQRLENLLKITKLNFYTAILHDTLVLLSVVAAIILYLYSQAVITPQLISSVAVFLLLSRKSLHPLSVLNIAVVDLAKLAAGADSLEMILSLEDKYVPRTGSKGVPVQFDDIRVENLSFTYPNGEQALKNVSIELIKGSNTVVVGRSGAGKTTLLNLLLKSYEVSPCSIFLGTEDLGKIDSASWAQVIAYIPQNTRLFTGTLRENLCLGLNLELADELLESMLERVGLVHLLKQELGGLDRMIGERGCALSRGEQQRISVARAMLQDPKLVIVDEATASLDRQTEKEITKVLSEFCKDRTAVFASHRLATINPTHRVVVLDKGEVVEQGVAAELLASESKFKKLWEAKA